VYCEYCGTSIDETALACPVCGNAREVEAPRPTLEAARSPMRDEAQVLAGPPCPEHPGMPLVGQCPRCQREVCVRCAPEAVFDDFTCTGCKGLTAAHAPAPRDAACAVHPEAAAAFICSRCGSFACSACSAQGVGAEGLCERCGGASGVELASRGNRFGANFVDNVAVLAPMLGATIVAGALLGGAARSDLWLGLAMLAGLGGGALIQIAAQLHWGQSVGKRLFGIKVVRMNGEPVELWRLLLLRNLLLNVLAQVVVIVGPIDALLIFGEGRRCLHDYLADTRVVNAEPGEKR